MVSCAWNSMDSPGYAPRPSFHHFDESTGISFAPRRLARRPSKLHTTMEVTRCRIGSTSRQAAPIGCEDFVPQKHWTPIYHAVYHDREAALQHFLLAGVSPDDMHNSGVPLLCVAAACGHFEIADMLLKAGANVDLASIDKGEAAIHVAIRTGRHDIVDLLLVRCVNLEARTFHTDRTALHYAAAGPYSLSMVTKLLKFGAKYDVKDMEGRTPAVVALQAHNLQAAVAIVNMARGKPKQLVKEKDMLMQHVEKSKDRMSVTNDLIANAFAATCDPDSTVLVEAIKKNDGILVQMFLEEGVDPQQATASGLLPLIVAIKFADLRIIKLLVQYGANVTARGPGNLDILQILFKTFTARDEDSVVTVVEYLLAKGVDSMALYPDGKTLLHRAVGARTDHAKVVTLLIKSGVGIDTQDKDGNTALHLAASNGLINTTQVLLEYHANATAVDSQNRTALLRAIQCQQWLVVPILAVPPALTAWDSEGSTALHHVAKSIPKDEDSWEDITMAMIPFCERGICRSMRDRSGATPLIQAIKSLPENGLPLIRSLLIEGDKKWNCIGHEDHKQQDALHYAAALGKVVFVQALLEHGAPFVLKDWHDDQKQAKLPASSRNRILELLVDSDRKRNALAADKSDGDVTGTRIEIIRSDLRTSSALSGYHADCEMERKTKANRSNSRKFTSMRHLQLPVQQRRSAAPSPGYPARTTSIQHRSREPAVHYHPPVQYRHARIPSSSSINQGIPLSTKTVHFTQQHDGEAFEASHEPATAFPPRTSSRRQIAESPKAATSEIHATCTEQSELLRNDSAIVATPPTKEYNAAYVPEPNAKERQPPPQPTKTSMDSIPRQTSIVAMDIPELANPRPSATDTTTSPGKATAHAATPPESEKKSSFINILSKPTTDNQPARIDSAVSLPPNNGTTNAVSAPGQSKPALRGETPKKKRQSGDELASWLAISSMLDRL